MAKKDKNKKNNLLKTKVVTTEDVNNYLQKNMNESLVDMIYAYRLEKGTDPNGLAELHSYANILVDSKTRQTQKMLLKDQFDRLCLLMERDLTLLFKPDIEDSYIFAILGLDVYISLMFGLEPILRENYDDIMTELVSQTKEEVFGGIYNNEATKDFPKNILSPTYFEIISKNREVYNSFEEYNKIYDYVTFKNNKITPKKNYVSVSVFEDVTYILKIDDLKKIKENLKKCGYSEDVNLKDIKKIWYTLSTCAVCTISMYNRHEVVCAESSKYNLTNIKKLRTRLKNIIYMARDASLKSRENKHYINMRYFTESMNKYTSDRLETLSDEDEKIFNNLVELNLDNSLQTFDYIIAENNLMNCLISNFEFSVIGTNSFNSYLEKNNRLDDIKYIKTTMSMLSNFIEERKNILIQPYDDKVYTEILSESKLTEYIYGPEKNRLLNIS